MAQIAHIRSPSKPDSKPASKAADSARTAADLNLDDVVEVTKAVGDRLRARILRALRGQSYSVSELCHILDVPQPALSHHLKVLHVAQLVARRREGNSIFYRRRAEPNDALRQALFDAVDATPLDAQLNAGAAEIYQQRHDRSNAFFADNAHRFADQQALISEADVYVPTIVDAIAHAGVSVGPVLEVGPGGGQLLALLAERFDEVVGIDSSATMLEQAAERVGNLANVKLWQKDFTELPAGRKYRIVIAAMVVHHLASPQRFFHDARRVIRREGVLVVAELCRHDHQWVTDACGDQWLGFEAEELTQWAGDAGFEVLESQYLAQKNGFRIQIHSYSPTGD